MKCYGIVLMVLSYKENQLVFTHGNQLPALGYATITKQTSQSASEDI